MNAWIWLADERSKAQFILMSDAVASTPQAVRQFSFIVGEDGNLHKDVYHGTSTLLVADNNWCYVV